MVKQQLLAAVVLAVSLSGCEIPFDGFFVGNSSVQSRFEQSMEINQNHPRPDFVTNSNEYALLLGADLHLNTAPQRFSRFLRLASEGDYLFSSILGDYVYELGASVKPVADSLEAHSSIRLVPVIGNHEVYKDKWDDFKQYFGSSVYYFTVRGIGFQDLYIVLDSGNGTLGEKQTDWLKTILPLLRYNHRHCIVFTHNNFFRPKGSSSMTALLPQEELYQLFDLFAKNRVDLVFTGHDHKHDRTTLKGVTYISLAAMRQEISPSEMCDLRFSADGKIQYTFIDSDRP